MGTVSLQEHQQTINHIIENGIIYKWHLEINDSVYGINKNNPKKT
jgi:hypothetical protein